MQTFPTLAISGMALGITLVTSSTAWMISFASVSQVGSSLFAVLTYLGWMLFFSCWYIVSSRFPR